MDTPAARRWSSILAEAEATDVSTRVFAHARGLNPQTLAWWKWRLKRSPIPAPGQSGFLPIHIVENKHLDVHVGDVRITVDDATDLALLKRVVLALE